MNVVKFLILQKEGHPKQYDEICKDFSKRLQDLKKESDKDLQKLLKEFGEQLEPLIKQVRAICCYIHYQNTPMQYTENVFGCKNENFHWKNSDIFLIFAQNIDCGYTLESPPVFQNTLNKPRVGVCVCVLGGGGGGG